MGKGKRADAPGEIDIKEGAWGERERERVVASDQTAEGGESIEGRVRSGAVTSCGKELHSALRRTGGEKEKRKKKRRMREENIEGRGR